ncbi:MAG: DedA family protein [Pantoea sp. Brub]|nr:DedA family protein [Pantoea sp. Brub]
MSLNIKELIIKYGYLAIFTGCVAEGETFTILGGVAVHEGLLHYIWVLIVSMIGGILGDQILYWIGNHYGVHILYRIKKHKSKILKVNKLIKTNPSLFVIGVRFMYGFRIIGPIIIGASHLNPIKFFILNIIGAAIWSLLFVNLGYYAGSIIIPILHKINEYMRYLVFIMIITLLIFLIIKFIYFFCKKKYK